MKKVLLRIMAVLFVVLGGWFCVTHSYADIGWEGVLYLIIYGLVGTAFWYNI